MKFLIISSTPSHAGSEHLERLGRIIARKGHDATFIYAGATCPADVRDEMRAFWPEFIEFPLSGSPFAPGARTTADAWYKHHFGGRFLPFTRHNYDVAIIAGAEMSAAALELHNAFRVIVPSLPVATQDGPLPQTDFCDLLPDEQRKILNRADAVLSLRDEERKMIASLGFEAILYGEMEEALSGASPRREATPAPQSPSVKPRNKKRLLLISDRSFWLAGVGTNQRIRSMVDYFARFFDVKVFVTCSPDAQTLRRLQESQYRDQVVIWRNYEDPGATWGHAECRAALPPSSARSFNPRLFNALARYARESEPFDSVLIFYIWNAYLAWAIPYRLLRILDTMDLFSWRKFLMPYDIPHFPFNEELAAFSLFDAVLFVQTSELEYVRKHLPKSISLYSSAFNDPATIVVQQSKGANFGYLGGGNVLNRDAVEWFLANVWPLQNRDDARLHIFGEVGKFFGNLPSNVVNHGFTQDLEDAFTAIDIFINPDLYGTGISYKTVAAMTWGKPVLASPAGARGIPEEGHNGILVARNRSEFIDGMIRLSRDVSLRERLGRDALATAQRHFSMAACYGEVMRLIRNWRRVQ